MSYLLLASAFVVATCGLIYELIAGTLASYLLGDSVTQFSTVIGAYLFAMGIGSWLSRYVKRRVISVFIQVEILIGAIGGCSAMLLFLLFDYVSNFRLALYLLVLIIGTLVGLEIPLLLRILKDRFEFSDLVSRVLTVDYIGALIASLLFPLILVPQLGLIRTAFLFGLFNVLLAVILIRKLPERHQLRLQLGTALSVAAGLVAGFIYAPELTTMAESGALPGTIIYSKSTPYQRIVLTGANGELRLFLNGNLQFSSRDEYRYHEALVHPVMSSMAQPRHVLILGGGDGLAAREVLRYRSVEDITLVDLDPQMTKLFAQNNFLRKLNKDSLISSRLKVVNADAFLWLKGNRQQFDVAIVDFPDPSNYSLGKLYSVNFYRLLNAALQPHGRAVIQTTSPYVARQTFWCVAHTVAAAGFGAYPYHTLVPSFGDWGFVLASKDGYNLPTTFPEDLRFIAADMLPALFSFPPDIDDTPTEVNRLDNQMLVRYFDKEWGDYLAY